MPDSLGAHLYTLRTSDVSKISGGHTINGCRVDRLDWPPTHGRRMKLSTVEISYILFSTNYKHHLQAYASGQHVLRKSYYGGVEGGMKIGRKAGQSCTEKRNTETIMV